MADNPTQPPFLDDYSGVREYIGARYVPVFANPPEWDNSRGYEPLTIVLYQGNSYTSTQTVPPGIEITNTEFWAETGNYNAQIEEYRKEVHNLSVAVSEWQTQLDSVNANLDTATSDIENLQTDVTMIEAAHMLKGKTAIFLGDSITYGQDSNSETGQVTTTWPLAMANLLGFTQTNIAVGGATGADYSGAPSTAISQAQSINKAYDYCFLMFGTNDYGYQVTLDATYLGIKAAVNNLQSRFPNMKIIGVIPPYMPGDTVANTEQHATALDYKMRCRIAYNDCDCPFIDFTQGLGWNNLNWDSKLMAWDTNLTRLHPNQNAYLEMGHYAASTFQVNGQTTKVNTWRNATAKVASPLNGCTFNAQPPASLLDELTGNLFIDLGDGIIIPESYTGGSIAKLDVPKHIYKATYMACAMLNGVDVEVALLALTPDNELTTVGRNTLYNGRTIYGIFEINFAWLID